MRRYSIIFLIASLLPAALVTTVNLLVDPYRIYHKPWLRDNYYVNKTDMRVEASGIINTEQFDALILGTSMADNFSAAEASEIFGRKYVNISLKGASMAERSVVLSYALEKRRLNTIIYSLDTSAFDKDLTPDMAIVQYAYLYDKYRWNDFPIYGFDLKLSRFALCQYEYFSHDQSCRSIRELDTLVEWYSNPELSKRFGGLHKWLEKPGSVHIDAVLKDVATSINSINAGKIAAVNPLALAKSKARHQQVFRDNLLHAVEKYPETQFYLFFPPYSRLHYALSKQGTPQKFAEYLEILRFVVSESARYPNIRVFGFETEAFLDDIANYIDTIHYHPRFNSKMLYWMKERKHELTLSNLDAYIAEISLRADAYSLGEIGAEVDAHFHQEIKSP